MHDVCIEENLQFIDLQIIKIYFQKELTSFAKGNKRRKSG